MSNFDSSPCLKAKLLALAGALYFSIASASAVILVGPANGGSISANIGAGGTLYYFVTTGGTYNLGNSFIRFTPLDVSVSQATDSSSMGNMIQLNVSTTIPVSLTGSQQAAVTLVAFPNTGAAHQAPIAAVNGTSCASSGACIAYNWTNGTPDRTTNHYYAATYSGSGTIKIGIYPNDICEDARRAGMQVTGCSASTPSTLVFSNGLATLQLAFSISLASDAVYTTTPAGQTVDTTTTPITLSFQSGAGSFSCPSSDTLNNNYVPADGKIILDTSGFSFSPPSGGGAPLGLIKAVGKNNSTPDISSTFDSGGNDFVSSTSAAINAQVTGFANSTETTQYKYYLSFIGQDLAGIYTPPASVASCQMGPVETSSIRGFLPEGTKNCFIATAAYGSINSAPVVMLREFRDRILSHSHWGRNLIQWYYGWSPKAAGWLMEHSEFKIPVLIVLIPIEIVAWLFLHPVLWMSAVLMLTGAVIARQEYLRRRAGSN